MSNSFLDKLRHGEVVPNDIDEYLKKWHEIPSESSEELYKYLGLTWEEFSRWTAANRLIPKGHYCYDEHGVCPFWSIDKNHKHQDNGYCSYLKKGDWDFEGPGILWDQCKECSLEPSDPNEEEIIQQPNSEVENDD